VECFVVLFFHYIPHTLEVDYIPVTDTLTYCVFDDAVVWAAFLFANFPTQQLLYVAGSWLLITAKSTLLAPRRFRKVVLTLPAFMMYNCLLMRNSLKILPLVFVSESWITIHCYKDTCSDSMLYGCFMYVYVCTYVCMYYVCVNEWMYVCTYVRTYYVCMKECMYECMYVCMHVRMYALCMYQSTKWNLVDKFWTWEEKKVNVQLQLYLILHIIFVRPICGLLLFNSSFSYNWALFGLTTICILKSLKYLKKIVYYFQCDKIWLTPFCFSYSERTQPV
jgi:hypothetical protein